MQPSMYGRLDIAVLTVCLMLAMPAASALEQPAATSDDMVGQLAGLEATADVDVAALRQQALDRIKSKADAVALKRPPVAAQLRRLPHLDLDIQFNPDFPVIRPESYRTLGRIADALSDLRLLPFGFLIVGHTDATGKRDNNLTLSQRRAEIDPRRPGDDFQDFAKTHPGGRSRRGTTAGCRPSESRRQPADRDRDSPQRAVRGGPIGNFNTIHKNCASATHPVKTKPSEALEFPQGSFAGARHDTPFTSQSLSLEAGIDSKGRPAVDAVDADRAGLLQLPLGRHHLPRHRPMEQRGAGMGARQHLRPAGALQHLQRFLRDRLAAAQLKAATSHLTLMNRFQPRARVCPQ